MPVLPSPPLAGYDEAEALDLLNRVSDKLAPDVKGRIDAVERLLAALVRLDGRFKGVQFSVAAGDGGGVWVMANDLSAKVVLDGKGGVLVSPKAGKGQLVPLVYNSEQRLLESTKPDSFRVPTPGEPVARRSALAEVLEQALRTVNAL